MNEHFTPINEKPNRLQKPATQQNEEEEGERECLSTAYSKQTQSAGWKGNDF